MQEGRDKFLLNNPSGGMGVLQRTGMNNGTSMEVDESNNKGELRLEGRLVRDGIRNKIWRKGYRQPKLSSVVPSFEIFVIDTS